LRVWPGPQWDLCPEPERSRFFDSTWQISPQSNRVGYRLEGAALKIDCGELISEPVRTGSIQVPPNGQPIITMRDGPTVGGYPKLGLVHPKDISWLAQCKPGQNVRFKLIEDT
jgi:allophanate hydrolase subunit 2